MSNMGAREDVEAVGTVEADSSGRGIYRNKNKIVIA